MEGGLAGQRTFQSRERPFLPGNGVSGLRFHFLALQQHRAGTTAPQSGLRRAQDAEYSRGPGTPPPSAPGWKQFPELRREQAKDW